MPTNPISPLPTPPSRNDDPDTFVTRSDAFIGALPVFVSQTNQLAGDIETDAGIINGAIEQAEDAASDALESAGNAADSEAAAAQSENNAEIFAAAAQEAIGVPSLAGNAFLPLRVNAAEDGVEFENLIAPAFAFAVKTDAATTTSTSFVDTGLSVSITPKRADSKIVLYASVTGAGSSSNFVFADSSNGILEQGDAAGPRSRSGFVLGGLTGSAMGSASGAIVLDAVSTSERSYKLRWRTQASTGALNRSLTDEDSAFAVRAISSLIAMEIFQ